MMPASPSHRHALRQHEYTAPGNHATLTEVAAFSVVPRSSKMMTGAVSCRLDQDTASQIATRTLQQEQQGHIKALPAGPLFKFIYRWTPNGDPEKVRPIHYWYAPPSDGRSCNKTHRHWRSDHETRHRSNRPRDLEPAWLSCGPNGEATPFCIRQDEAALPSIASLMMSPSRNSRGYATLASSSAS